MIDYSVVGTLQDRLNSCKGKTRKELEENADNHYWMTSPAKYLDEPHKTKEPERHARYWAAMKKRFGDKMPADLGTDTENPVLKSIASRKRAASQS